MIKASDILGLNARNASFGARNSKRARRSADSKLEGKKILEKAGIITPKLLAVFETPEKVIHFVWEELPGSFVVKPEDGNGGKGVWVIRRRARWAGEWWRADGTKINIGDLRLHILDILEGKFSAYDKKTRAFAEERIPIDRAFNRYAYKGTPDIRVIVFNKVPVMAMLRLPTKESEGKANIHQGAIGLGIDLATGVTTYGVHKGKTIRFMPKRRSKVKRKVNGLKIPKWNQALLTAVACQEASRMAFVGVDLVLHPTIGVMVLELNKSPGLDIQLANKAGLRRRLERVRGLEVRDAEHGVKIAKALFASSFAEKVKIGEEKIVIDNIEEIKIRLSRKERAPALAKVDTGAFRSSIDKKVAKELGLLKKENILWTRGFYSGLGREKRPVIGLTFFLKGRKVKTAVNVSDRGRMKTKFLIGRRDLQGYLVSPADKIL